MKQSYKTYTSKENQAKIRDKLFQVLKSDGITLRILAKEIDISLVTILKFLKDEKDVDFIRLSKIEKWVDKNASR